MKAGRVVGREERWAERPARIMVIGGAVGLVLGILTGTVELGTVERGAHGKAWITLKIVSAGVDSAAASAARSLAFCGSDGRWPQVRRWRMSSYCRS